MDEGRYLRVVVKYLDMGVKDTDDGVTVRMVREEVAVSVNPVREEMSSDLDGVGNTENGSPGFSPADSYTRTVPENSPVGTPIGDPVVAVDPNDDTLTYELDDDMDADPADRSGDVGHFSIDMATSHITVEKRLDYEDNADGYEFYVRAIDPSGETAEVMVTVIASDANDAPVIMGSKAADATDPTPDAAFELRVNELDDDDEACSKWRSRHADPGQDRLRSGREECLHRDGRGRTRPDLLGDRGRGRRQTLFSAPVASAGPMSRSRSCSGTRPTTRLRPMRTGTTFTGLPWLPGTATARWTPGP